MTNKFLIKSTFDDDEGRKKHFEFFKLWEALLSSETKNYAYIEYKYILRFGFQIT